MKITVLILSFLGIFCADISAQNITSEVSKETLTSKSQLLEKQTNTESSLYLWIADFKSSAERSILENELLAIDGLTYLELDLKREICTIRFSVDSAKSEAIEVISELGFQAEVMQDGPQSLIPEKQNRHQ